MTRRRRWAIGLGLPLLLFALLVGRPACHVARTAWADRFGARYDETALPPGVVDDASRLQETRVAKIVDVPSELGAAERMLAEVFVQAKREGRRVAISGTRHTMGGHTQLPDAIVVNMLPLAHLDFDRDKQTLRAGAGARWRDVIRFLDERGLSVAVMQSNNDFSIGGSLGANCHGWQPRRGPIGSTVRALKVITADGRILRASRDENAELFSLVIGGYGLFGVALEAELEVVPNDRYRPKRFVMPVERYVDAWQREVRDDTGMAFGRLSVAPDSFLSEATITVFEKTPGTPPARSATPLEPLRRAIFRGSAGSAYGKTLRWKAERALSEQLGGEAFSRNQLLDESASVYSDRSQATTDILHEYFVPLESFVAFVADLGRIVKAHGADLLNVTLRDVRTDEVSLLRYADRDMIALVLLFNHSRTNEADERARAMTRELVDAAIARGGRHYLPYRLHASREQLLRAYPAFERFIELKRRWDPDELFQNRFWTTYGAAP